MRPDAPSLLEREEELAALQAVLAAAAGGNGGVVLLEGEPGIGKTSLLAAARRHALERGFECLTARGDELEVDLPFGLVLQLLEERLRRAEPDEREALLSGAAGLARPLLEAATAEALPQPSLVHGVFWVLTNLAERAPLLLAVDDAHLGDAPSLRLLVYLARRIAELPLAAVLAARPADPGPAAELLPNLRAQPATRVVRPRALSRNAVGHAVAAAGFPGGDPQFVRACAEASGGNPLYLRELLAVLAERAVEATAASSGLVSEIGPRSVAVATELALARLAPGATALARSVAVLGESDDVASAAALAGLDPRVAVEAAAALAGAGLLRGGEVLAFAHPIVRASVYDALTPAERGFMHAQAARLLHDRDEPGEAAASHLLLAPRVGARWALHALRRAAARARERGEPASAARLLRRALLEAPERAARGSLLVELAGAETAAGEPTAVGHFEEALALLDDPVERARAMLALGRLHLHRGAYAEAVAAFDDALDALADRDAALAAELGSGRAAALMWLPGGGPPAVPDGGVRGNAPRQPLAADSTAHRLLLAQGANLAMLALDRPRALEHARRAWAGGALLVEVGPEEPALFSITAAFAQSDELDEFDAVLTAILAAARERGLLGGAMTPSWCLAQSQLQRLAIPDARATLELALDARGQPGGSWAGGALHTHARILLAAGDRAGARRALALTPEHEKQVAQGFDYAGLLTARGRVALAHHDAPAAVRVLDEAGALMARLGWQVPSVYGHRPPLARALVSLGRGADARTVAEEELALARRWGARSGIGAALRALAATHEDDAVELLTEAVAVLEESPTRRELAGALLELGAGLRARGDVTAAREPLRRALDLADQGGAVPLVERARRELVAAGGRPRHARRTGILALTPGELRVARLAAAGRTNRQIAEDLFVTVRAVRWHLNNAYRKLGVEARDELAAALPPFA